MYDLFKNLFDKTPCSKNGICSTNPVLNSLEAVIVNEIRQIAFYVVKLKELNLTNKNLMKESVLSLSVSVYDMDFNKDSFIGFFKNILNTKNKVKDFYLQKCKKMNIPYEVISPIYEIDEKKLDITTLTKFGEEIISKFYNKVKNNIQGLFYIIILGCKITSVDLIKLSLIKDDIEEYLFEILRLLSITNNIATREDKLIRRIKEFSNVIYKIRADLDFEYSKKYSKRSSYNLSCDIYKGKSLLVGGGDIEELYDILNALKYEDINIYLTHSMLIAPSYPAFRKFEKLKGLYKTGTIDMDFSNFKGGIYLTKNSIQGLDSIYRGNFYTSKIIPPDRAAKIKDGDYKTLIEDIKKLEGFMEDKKGKSYQIDFNLDNIQDLIEKNEDKNFLISLGQMEESEKEKFRDDILIEFLLPYETEGLHFVLNKVKDENIKVYFTYGNIYVLNTVFSLLEKNIKEIYLKKENFININPHIIDSLRDNFNIKIV